MSMTGIAAPASPGMQVLPPNNNTGSPLPDLPATSFAATPESASSGGGAAAAGGGAAAASTGGAATSAPGKRKLMI